MARLNIIAAVRANATLGDLRYQSREGRAVLIVGAKADSHQRQALVDLARSMAGRLIADVVDIKVAAIKPDIGRCRKSGYAKVIAEARVSIATHCLGTEDHVCGNEQAFSLP